MAKSYPFPDALEQYEKLVATLPGLERKGDTMPYTSINGHMFSYLHKDGKLALKLPAGLLPDFLAKYNTKLQEAYGIVQKEYAVVPEDLLAKTDELAPYLKASYDYVASQKPKPTKKGK